MVFGGPSELSSGSGERLGARVVQGSDLCIRSDLGVIGALKDPH